MVQQGWGGGQDVIGDGILYFGRLQESKDDEGNGGNRVTEQETSKWRSWPKGKFSGGSVEVVGGMLLQYALMVVIN